MEHWWGAPKLPVPRYEALDSYLSAVEDGLRVGIERERTAGSDKAVEANLRLASGRAAGSQEQVERTTGQDTSEARFARLLALAHEDQDSLGWVEVLDPDSDLVDVGFGAIVEGEAEFYVPTMIRALADSSGLTSAMDLMDAFEPLADVFGLDLQGVPDQRQREGMRAAVSAMGAGLVAVGEFAGSEWRVAGQLAAEHSRADVEGPARFVGKVAKQWPTGEGRHLLALPGTSLLPRKERRELERRRPQNDDDDSFLVGPALMLDVLAVWR